MIGGPERGQVALETALVLVLVLLGGYLALRGLVAALARWWYWLEWWDRLPWSLG